MTETVNWLCPRCLELEGRLRAEQEETRRLTTALELSEVGRDRAERAEVKLAGDLKSIEKGS